MPLNIDAGFFQLMMFQKQHMPRFYLFFIIGFCAQLAAQSHTPSWQQKIHYQIDAELSLPDRLVGKEKFKYMNNSPDTLYTVYLNLYVNAFGRGSHMQAYQETRDEAYGGSIISYLPDRLLGYHRVDNIRDENGNFLEFEIDDTILKILLEKPILPHSDEILYLDFELKIPWILRRMGRQNREGVDFSMAQWYPKLCVYDQKGWHKNYYLAREFYGEWATFDVSLTLPAPYVVGASGALSNASNIENMMKQDPDSTTKDRLLQSPAPFDTAGKSDDHLQSILSNLSQLAQQKSTGDKNRTWLYHAGNIHDFAWCADPDYRHETMDTLGVRLHLLYLPDVADKWKEMKDWTAQILQYMTTQVGKYPYRDFTIAQAGDGGMEYPNIVFITGNRGRFSLASVTAHEMAHNWFYGLLANDETQEAWMDEGITSYYTTRLMEHMLGRYVTAEYESPFKQKYYPKQDARVNTYTGYLWWAKQGFEEKVMGASDYFLSDQSYNYSVYFKGEIFMFVLEYYFGRDRLDRLMQKYFSVWQGHHVSTEDMKRFFEKETGVELDWLFEEWLNTTKQCDYAVVSHSGEWKNDSDGRYVEGRVALKRIGEIEMPMDVILRMKNGKTSGYRIPTRNDDPDISGLQRMPVWDLSTRTYEMYIRLNDAIESVEVDSSLLLPDVNRRNNRSGILPNIEWHFQKPVGYSPTLDSYLIEHRPSLWHNSIDAVRIGYQFKGQWNSDEHRTKLGLYYGVKNHAPDYDFTYSTPFYSLGRQTTLSGQSYKLEGRTENSAVVSRRLHDNAFNRPPFCDYSIGFRTSALLDADYLPPKIGWDKGRVNVLYLTWGYQPRLFSSSYLELGIESSTLGSRWDFSKFHLRYKLPITIRRNYFSATVRLYAGYGTGDIPVQEQFYFSGASPRELFENKFYRSRGTLPDVAWQRKKNGNRHLYYDGGGSVAGYYDANIFSRRLMAYGLDLNFFNPARWALKKTIFVITEFDPYLFSEGGWAWNSNNELKGGLKELYLMDAGFGAKYFLKFVPSWWGAYVLRFDFPIWINRPHRIGPNEKSLSLRWLMGLDHDF